MASAVKLFAVVVYSSLTTWTVSPDGFVTLNCLQENHGVYGKDSVIQCSVKSNYPRVKIMALVWSRPRLAPPLLFFLGGAPRYMGLIVTSVPESNIQDDTAVEMFCSARGGYPEGTIQWFDQYGTDWTRSAEAVSKVTMDGRFNIISRFAVRRVSSSSPRYTCCLFNSAGDKEAETDLHLSFAIPGRDKTMERRSKKAIAATIVVFGSLTCGFLVLILFRRSKGCGPGHQHSDEEPVRVAEGFSNVEENNAEP